ncbi:IclR family transcriptional regulator [Streptomyces sp. CB01249]|uniref:IclR family transcriptional regulator n=1 Tax=unclassified Streptomyces TaxID=2593676 RepID=UPI00036467E0|nr:MULTISPECIES: IclR family transcriptional regulator [unclassified Streptomyces]MYQ79824.1 helix-turn-helix domain-containing protein [Streptomyces sp. SID4923]OKI93070.1 IclR family transcriptional regulator [Streptomyces sp. CB01249]WUD04126.1 IclR family transcriptional regulator [Streptomyces sp. NBC_00523]
MLDKAAAVLDCYRPDGGAFRLTEIAARTGLAKTTAFRLCADLVRLGLLDRAGETYRLGGKLFELGSLVPRRQDLREAALPFLQDLFEATHETVHLGVREGFDVVYVERIHGHDALALPSRIGGRLPLTCTGVGKALLAFSDGALVEEVLARPLPRLSPHSITDPVRLRTVVEQIQVSGLAYEEQEAAVGVSCIASPVFDGPTAVAALSVAVPRARFRPAQLAPAVRTAALGLSRVMRGTARDRS